MTLSLHSGGELIDYAALRELETPPATATHVPIPHHRVVDLVKYALGYHGHEVYEEHHAVDKDGMRYFGLLSLRSPHTGYTDTVGLRNSHDRKFPVGIGFGSRVFVCSNLAFIADHVIRRKHTKGASRELPGLIAELVEPLTLQREAQARTFERYKDTPLSDQQADHAIMTMYREGVVSVTRIADVALEWDRPTFDEFDRRNAWRLFNAATFSLRDKVIEDASLTPKLHRIIDGVCETIN